MSGAERQRAIESVRGSAPTGPDRVTRQIKRAADRRLAKHERRARKAVAMSSRTKGGSVVVR